jgi:hypothetical protein
MNTKYFVLFMFTAVIFLGGITRSASAGTSDAPELPPACSTLGAGLDQAPIFHVYASGVQVYRWNGMSWDFVAPDANLFAEENYYGQVGRHSAGPTWESNSGSKVVARKVDECTPDTSAIPWLKLEKVSSTGPGIFGKIGYILRVNTTGGLKPTTAGSTVGDVQRVPYAAEYYFYKGGVE